MARFNDGMKSSNRGDWATPQAFFAELDAEFGFVLDVCATPENAKCKRFFSVKDDGLAQVWDGPAFMNPPYGREIPLWVEKAYRASRKGITVVGLLPARTDTRWWHDWVLPYAEVRFIKGRLKFDGQKNSAPFPSAIAIWGNDAQRGGV